MTTLHREEITERVHALQTSLTTMQMARLTTIRDLIDKDGRFQLRAALTAGEFPQGDAKAQDAFQDFRHKVNALAKELGVDLQLVLDSRKTTPDRRYGWFAGDPVETGLLSYTKETSERTGITRPVAPEVKELGESRRFRVYVGFHPTTGSAARRAAALIQHLQDALGVLEGQSWEVRDSRSPALGEDAEQARDRMCAQADVRVALISPAFLGASQERHRVFGERSRVLAFPFGGLPDAAPVDLSPLRRHDVAPVEPWTELTRSAQRSKYINALVSAIQRAVFSAADIDGAQAGTDKSVFIDLLSRQLRVHGGYDSKHLVPAELAESALAESLLLSGHTSPPLRAVDRLVAWATDNTPGAPRLCAVLGDVGMGKTTTTKLFAQRLLEMHQQDSAVPIPILFDLRDVRVTTLGDSMTIDDILNHMLDATRPAGVPRDRLDADVVRKRLEHGHTVIVFDGLDEVLVHLSPHDRQLFTRQLWRALPDQSTARMLITCRTQYFRSIRDEATYFTGETRQGLRGNDYLALLMLPFRTEQIRDYLAGNLDRTPQWVDQFLETIAAVHDLTDLASRPITLRLIADQVEFIETAKLEGRTLRSVDIYSEVVDRWISRDEGKHTLTPDHKRLLMEEIAAGLWRSGQNSWSPAQVDNWLLDLLDRRPDLRRHYRAHLPDLWTADFRTATFLTRDGDTFAFGHRSLFEYFLARYLLRILCDAGMRDPELDDLAMPVPSRETLTFLGESIAGVTLEGRTNALETLQIIGHKYRPRVSEFALAYALHAHRRGFPLQSLSGIRLAGAALSGWRIGGEDHAIRLTMTGADFTAADLRHTIFHGVELTNADLSGADTTSAEFQLCTLTQTSWVGARMAGTILRRCEITDVDLSHAQTYRTQLLTSTPAPAPDNNLVIAPTGVPSDLPNQDEVQLRHFTGHSRRMVAVAWSPDGAHILTGSDDNTARIWDATTGEETQLLTGHDASTRAVAWSPDGAHILTGSDDNTARIWDATTGEETQLLTGHDASVLAVAWSPDGTHILTGSAAGARIWDATTGEETQRVAEHTGFVLAVAWSPDGTRILTGGDDGTARICDAITGEETQLLTGHDASVLAVAWSPDGNHILTGDEHGVRIYSSATGAESQLLSRNNSHEPPVAWSPDGAHILTGSITGAQIWDTTGTGTRRIGHFRRVSAVAWSPDGTHMVTLDDHGLHIWDAATGDQTQLLTTYVRWINAVAWSHDGTHILIGAESSVHIWHATTGTSTQHLTGHSGTVMAAAWSPDGTHILTGSLDGSARLWDATAGIETQRLTGSISFVRAVAWSPDGNHILTGGDDGTAHIRDATTGEETQRLTGHTNFVGAVEWSPDGNHISTGGDDGTTRIWDTTTGAETHRLTEHNAAVQAVAWSPDGRHILTGDVGTVRIWDISTGRVLRRLIGHTDYVRAVAWSPDGNHILTGGDDGTARIWDTNTGQETHRLTGHTNFVRAVAWSPDGNHILTGSVDGTARIWDATTGEASGFVFAALPGDDLAVYHAGPNTVIGCTDGAWRWLGWRAIRDGQVDRLPAETFGELPPLRNSIGYKIADRKSP